METNCGCSVDYCNLWIVLLSVEPDREEHFNFVRNIAKQISVLPVVGFLELMNSMLSFGEIVAKRKKRVKGKNWSLIDYRPDPAFVDDEEE